MSPANNSVPTINYFIAPFGVLQNKVADEDQPNSISNRVDRVRDGSKPDVTPLVDDLFNNARDLNSLYGLLSQPEKWQDVSTGDTPAYRVTTGEVDFTVSIRPVPDRMRESIGEVISRYVFMDFYSKKTDIRSVYGIGFYTESNGPFTEKTFALFLINYVQQLMLEMSKLKPSELSKLTEAAYEKLSDEAWKKASKVIKKVVPGFVIDGIAFAINPSVNHAVSIAESVLVGLVPSLIGKILLYVTFKVLNYILEDGYNIRYAIVNRNTYISFKLEEAYKKYTGKLPDILSDSHDNIMHRVNQAPYFSSLDNNNHEWKRVMQVPTFAIKNDGVACPSILVRLEKYYPDSISHPGYDVNNILSAYDIEYWKDNKQGAAVYPHYNSKDAEGVYNYLTEKSQHRCQESYKPLQITQVTNALSGIGDETYDVVLVIDNL